MNKLTDLGANVEADIAKDNLKELIFEKADDMMESLIRITGLSVLFKLSKVYSSVKDYFLMEKIVAFLTDLSSMNVSQRKNLIKKLNDEPIYGQTLGKFIIIALDRLEYVDKAQYIARACKFYEREDISQSLLIRIKGIIEKIELNQLKDLAVNKVKGQYEYFGYPKNFDSAGLYLFQSLDLLLFEHTASDFKEYNQLLAFGKGRDFDSPTPPELTVLGKVLIHIIHDEPFDIWLKQSVTR